MQKDTFKKTIGQVQHITVDADHHGQRIDNFLLARLKGVPRSVVYRIIRKGEVRVNKKRVKPPQHLDEGDLVRIPPVHMDDRATKPVPESRANWLEKRIIFEDKHFLVLDKPFGLASHGGSGISHGVIELMRASRPEQYLELAHRLDRDTSGVIVLARKRQALIALQALIRDGAVTKQYLALLMGKLDRPKFDVNAPLAKFSGKGGERFMQVANKGKPSLTFFKQVERYKQSSLMQVTLASGRTHQIRVHARHAGFPVAGDRKYGDRENNKLMQQKGLKRLFLHAARFEFELNDKSYSFTTPLPEELRTVVDALQRP